MLIMFLKRGYQKTIDARNVEANVPSTLQVFREEEMGLDYQTRNSQRQQYTIVGVVKALKSDKGFPN